MGATKQAYGRRVPWLHPLVLSGLCVALYFKFRPSTHVPVAEPAAATNHASSANASPIEQFRVDSASSYFPDNGYIELVPPLRLPRRNPRNRVEVWLQLPEGSQLKTRRSDAGVQLELPHGARAARVERSDASPEATPIYDVRGTRFEADGEHFFVMRPTGEANTLTAWLWRRDSPEEQTAATDRIAAYVADRSPTANREAQRRAMVANNACASCHVYGRSANERPGEFGKVNRGTDASGCFQVQNILVSRLPVETYFPLEQNTQDPFIRFDCDGRAPGPSAGPAEIKGDQVACANGSVPYGKLDVRAALAAGDARVRRVCAGRRYLYQHLDAAGRSAFQSGFAECGITE
ncbi:MAG: hypothetical protein AB7S68_22280 [Polyangiaceae bacterium]